MSSNAGHASDSRPAQNAYSEYGSQSYDVLCIKGTKGQMCWAASEIPARSECYRA